MNLPPPPSGSQRWPTTRWTWLADLHCPEDAARRDRALERLCAAYNRPIIACLRELGFSTEDAEDIRQRFFLEVIDRRRLFHRAEKQRGHLRDYLRRSLRRFASNIVRERQAEKRGGITPHEPLAEEHSSIARGIAPASPAELFDREWALGLLDRALRRLGDECTAKGRTAVWQTLQPCLSNWDEGETPASAGARLGINANAIGSELYRLRARLRHILRALLSETAATPEEAEDDLLYLIRLLSR